MTPEISAWINKAERDWRSVLLEHSVERDPNLDAVCFHAQQCSEKYLKARLVLSSIAFRKSHDLLYLHQLALDAEPTWHFLWQPLRDLTAFAVAIRYPGLDATQQQADDAIKHCRIVRLTVRRSLELPDLDQSIKVCAGHFDRLITSTYRVFFHSALNIVKNS
ncbi:MAG: HEPN domain-containing protein [Pyrinomonadaceae bacterium]